MKFKLNKGFITQKLGDQTIIFDGEGSILYTLNETASFIFNKIKSGRDSKDIVKSLIREYTANAKLIQKDFIIIIKQLKEKKIIKKG